MPYRLRLRDVLVFAAALTGAAHQAARGHDTVAGGRPASGTADDARLLLIRAQAEIGRLGREAAFRVFDDPKGGFVDRDLYVFCVSPEGTMVAHGGIPGLIGKNVKDMTDSDGKKFIAEMLDVGKDGGRGWVDYKWPNPVTHRIEAKTSLVTGIGKDVCGVGIYKK